MQCKIHNTDPAMRLGRRPAIKQHTQCDARQHGAFCDGIAAHDAMYDATQNSELAIIVHGRVMHRARYNVRRDTEFGAASGNKKPSAKALERIFDPSRL